MTIRVGILAGLGLAFLGLLAGLGGARPARADVTASGATITVSTPADVLNGADGLCSLREAVIAANTDTASGPAGGECPAGSGADTIHLPAGVYSLTIPGIGDNASATGDLDILSPLSIVGVSSATTTIHGNGLDRVASVEGPVAVTLMDIAVVGGRYSYPGGGLYNTGVLTLTRSRIADNEGSSGGGILNGGALTVVNSEVASNTAFSEAGGILNSSGTLILIGSRVADNVAQSAGMHGGGIGTSAGTTILTDTVLQGNQACGGSALYSWNSLTRLAGVRVEANTHLGDPGYCQNAVIIYGGTAEISASTLNGNTRGGLATNSQAEVTLTEATVSGNLGGGLINSGVMTITGSRISRNGGSGVYTGGIRLVIRGTAIGENTSASAGGGVYVFGGTVELSDSAVYSNTALGHGGGIALYAYSPLVLTNVTVSGNRAYGHGGGLMVTEYASTIRLNSVTLTDNEADANGNGDGQGGGLYRTGTSANSVTLGHTILAGNRDGSPAPEHPDCYGALVSSGHNLAPAGCLIGGGTSGDLLDLLPGLAGLGDNGGPTPTRALLPGSPAIDAGDLAGCRDAAGAVLANDQRGFLRAYDGNGDGQVRCDIGAYEAGAALFVPTAWVYLPLLWR